MGAECGGLKVPLLRPINGVTWERYPAGGGARKGVKPPTVTNSSWGRRPTKTQRWTSVPYAPGKVAELSARARGALVEHLQSSVADALTMLGGPRGVCRAEEHLAAQFVLTSMPPGLAERGTVRCPRPTLHDHRPDSCRARADGTRVHSGRLSTRRFI